MSQLTDEQIQQLIEAGRSLPDMGSDQQAAETKQYQQLFKALKKELPHQPDAGFSARVMARIEGVESVPSQSGVHTWIWTGVAISLLMVGLSIVFTSWLMADLVGVLTVLKPIKGGIVFGLMSLLLIQWLDFKLIREPSLLTLS